MILPAIPANDQRKTGDLLPRTKNGTTPCSRSFIANCLLKWGLYNSPPTWYNMAMPSGNGADSMLSGVVQQVMPAEKNSPPKNPKAEKKYLTFRIRCGIIKASQAGVGQAARQRQPRTKRTAYLLPRTIARSLYCQSTVCQRYFGLC